MKIPLGKAAVTVLLIVALTVSPVLAQVQSGNQASAPYTTPDSPIYGLFTGIIEPFKLWLAKDPTAKAQAYMDVANERVAELQAMAAKGNHNYDGRLSSAYSDALNQTQKWTDKITDQQTRISIQNRVGNETAKHIEVLQRVSEAAPSQALQGLSRAINNADNQILHFISQRSKITGLIGSITFPACSYQGGVVTCSTTTMSLAPSVIVTATTTQQVTTVTVNICPQYYGPNGSAASCTQVTTTYTVMQHSEATGCNIAKIRC